VAQSHRYAAIRLDVAADSLAPQTIAWIFLGASLSAYGQWLKHEDADLIQLLESAFVMLRSVFGTSDSG
jgi:hypothetical protein